MLLMAVCTGNSRNLWAEAKLDTSKMLQDWNEYKEIYTAFSKSQPNFVKSAHSAWEKCYKGTDQFKRRDCYDTSFLEELLNGRQLNEKKKSDFIL